MKKIFLLSCLLISINGFAQSSFDSFTMTFGSAFNHLTPNTVSGHSYAIKVTGTYSVWCCIVPVDGAYKFLDGSGNPMTPIPLIIWSWNGVIAGNDTTLFRPIPNIYNSNHEYWYYFSGDGTQQAFSFWEDGPGYGDNQGSLFFEIFDNGCTTASITSSGSTIICGSGSILLTANANTSYQWKKNNAVIAGATNITYSAIATGSYTVTAINSCNTTSTSNAIQINKYALPTSTITANGATSFCTGGSVTLSSTTNAGVNALYQWYKGATAISGATNSSYIATTASTYKCKVTNSLTGCNRTSAGIVVTLVNPTASITASGPLTFCAGGNVLFTAVTNAGAGALYQWYKNSTGISGASNSTYTATVAGNYVVVVTNSYGCTTISAVKKVIINCRLEDSEISSSTFYVSPNPCSTCFVNGTMDEQDLIVTDIAGRKINVQFTKSETGFYINLSENDKGFFLIRNISTGEVVKFVRE